MIDQSGLREVPLSDYSGYRYASRPVEDVQIVKNGDVIQVGEFNLRCIQTAGHAPDHICLYEPTAAVAAERYIEELDAFNADVLQSDKKVLLLFFNALNNESLEFSTLLEEANQELDERYKVVKVDMATKKNLAKKYEVNSVPTVLVLDKGKKIKRLYYSVDKEKYKMSIN
ncbi:thioredoxin domain-containing protein [Desulfitobacterium sp. Sab5]|uniref:thioredoxin domain-containing protein n=1 Tax=Desulfitobacterium nosdiversum TaxID=3375356 RepID=UPI003CE6AF1E